MRRLSFAITTLLLLSPLAASAAYLTPSELATAMQSGAPRSFSLTAHANTPDKTYVSIWANGSMQGINEMDMQLATKVTVDIVTGDVTMRVKGEIMAIDGMLYLKIVSFNTSMQNELATLSANLKQHVWLTLPLDVSALAMIHNPAFTLSETDAAGADMTFAMATSSGKNSTMYTLTLKPDAAAQLALSIRDLLHDTQSMSDDFFPWRDLAESMNFKMIVTTDANDGLLGSSYEMSTKGTNSSFMLSGTEKPTATLNLKAPAGAKGLEEIASIFGARLPEYMGGSDLEMMMEPDMTEWTEDEIFDAIDSEPSSSCDDPSIDAMKKLSMQRDGSCPTEKTPTRYTR